MENKTKSELIGYYCRNIIEHLNDKEIKRLFYHIFGIKAYPDYNINYRYLIHSRMNPEIYKTRFNK